MPVKKATQLKEDTVTTNTAPTDLEEGAIVAPQQDAPPIPGAETPAETAPAGGKFDPFNVGDDVFVSRGKHRGQTGKVMVAAGDNQYVIQPTAGGAPIVVNRSSLREPGTQGVASITLPLLVKFMREVDKAEQGPDADPISALWDKLNSLHPGRVPALVDDESETPAQS